MSFVRSAVNWLTASPAVHDTRSTKECIDALQSYMGSSKVQYCEYNFDDLTKVVAAEVSFIHWLCTVLGKLPQGNHHTTDEEKELFKTLGHQHAMISTYVCEKGPRVLKKGMLHIYWLIITWDNPTTKRTKIRSQLEKFITVGDLTEIACTHRLVLDLDVSNPSSNVEAHSHCLRAVQFQESKSEPTLKNNKEDRILELWILEHFVLRNIQDTARDPFEIARMMNPGSGETASVKPVRDYNEGRRYLWTGYRVVHQMCQLASHWADMSDEKLRKAIGKLGITDGASFAYFIHENYFCPPYLPDFDPLWPKDSPQMRSHIKGWLEYKDCIQPSRCIHGFLSPTDAT